MSLKLFMFKKIAYTQHLKLNVSPTPYNETKKKQKDVTLAHVKTKKECSGYTFLKAYSCFCKSKCSQNIAEIHKMSAVFLCFLIKL